MQRVTIIGLGLIGGSIGLGLRRWASANGSGGRPALEVVGFSTNLDKQSRAERMKAVDRTAWDLPKAVEGADLVIIATPVMAMEEVFESIAPHLKPGAVVTDAASTKAEVMRWARERLPASIHFVGGHPMAGKTESIEGADPDLFNGATWVICPSVSADEEAVRTVLGMVSALGATAYFADHFEHDAFVAGISHLPFVLSGALVNAVSGDPSWRDMQHLAASGFRDVSRLALGSPAMYRDILLTNREAVTRWIDQFETSLGELRATLQQDPAQAGAEIEAWLSRAQDARAAWDVRTPRESELMPDRGEAAPEKFTDHVSRMFLGGLAKKRRPGADPDQPRGR
ncbi:MAG: prephenate dehydrogenase [Chloroflexota bacterium]